MTVELSKMLHLVLFHGETGKIEPWSVPPSLFSFIPQDLHLSSVSSGRPQVLRVHCRGLREMEVSEVDLGLSERYGPAIIANLCALSSVEVGKGKPGDLSGKMHMHQISPQNVMGKDLTNGKSADPIDLDGPKIGRSPVPSTEYSSRRTGISLQGDAWVDRGGVGRGLVEDESTSDSTKNRKRPHPLKDARREGDSGRDLCRDALREPPSAPAGLGYGAEISTGMECESSPTTPPSTPTGLANYSAVKLWHKANAKLKVRACTLGLRRLILLASRRFGACEAFFLCNAMQKCSLCDAMHK